VTAGRGGAAERRAVVDPKGMCIRSYHKPYPEMRNSGFEIYLLYVDAVGMFQCTLYSSPLACTSWWCWR
jgi:hypothetical protein